MSEISTCGFSPLARAARASSAEPKHLAGMFSRPRAFSSTQRMERSSSMIQTGFISLPFSLAST
jgi:hypothetical protein